MQKRIAVRTEGLAKTYRLGRDNLIKALDGVDFELEEGDFAALVGPSGSGKSTFMHLVGLLQSPDEGRVIINGEDMSRVPRRKYPSLRSRKIGFIFQGFNLIPNLTALENVVLAAKYARMPSRVAVQKSKEILTKLGLGDRMKHRPSELSGGQQQRVAIARALINNPAIILADEPTGELDTKTSAEIVKILQDLNQNGQTILIVTHNPEVAKEAKRIIKMADGKIFKE